ncbi:MAG: hypothetical protein MJY55_04135, partial [Bacteroidales bacterium]|nr:hypothetical protein [Bacteroidales bacterium]
LESNSSSLSILSSGNDNFWAVMSTPNLLQMCLFSSSEISLRFHRISNTAEQFQLNACRDFLKQNGNFSFKSVADIEGKPGISCMKFAIA